MCNEIQIPKTWGMFSSAGNRSLRLKAERLVKEVSGADDQKQIIRAFEKYFRGYAKLCRSKTMREAGREYVQDEVYEFAKMVAQRKVWDYSFLSEMWWEFSKSFKSDPSR